MPVRLVFRCQFCDAQPDTMTQMQLEEGVRAIDFGAYVDAPPGRWLAWHGQGVLGPVRYACPEHRGDLVAFLREHYGTVGSHPWKRPPYPTSVASANSTQASRRRGRGGGGFF